MSELSKYSLVFWTKDKTFTVLRSKYVNPDTAKVGEKCWVNYAEVKWKGKILDTSDDKSTWDDVYIDVFGNYSKDKNSLNAALASVKAMKLKKKSEIQDYNEAMKEQNHKLKEFPSITDLVKERAHTTNNNFDEKSTHIEKDTIDHIQNLDNENTQQRPIDDIQNLDDGNTQGRPVDIDHIQNLDDTKNHEQPIDKNIATNVKAEKMHEILPGIKIPSKKHLVFSSLSFPPTILATNVLELLVPKHVLLKSTVKRPSRDGLLQPLDSHILEAVHVYAIRYGKKQASENVRNDNDQQKQKKVRNKNIKTILNEAIKNRLNELRDPSKYRKLLAQEKKEREALEETNEEVDIPRKKVKTNEPQNKCSKEDSKEKRHEMKEVSKVKKIVIQEERKTKEKQGVTQEKDEIASKKIKVETSSEISKNFAGKRVTRSAARNMKST